MKILPKKIIQITLVVFFIFFISVNTTIAMNCCWSDQCVAELCAGDDNCSSTCEGASGFVGISCIYPGTCYTTYSTAHQCDGVPYGPCIDGCQTRTCEECYDGDIGCLHVLNIQGCDGMACGRQTNGTGSCHPASVPPPAPACDQTGLLHKYFTDSGTPYPIGL
jgi:hypothetical protein